jgi:hypothetical protein
MQKSPKNGAKLSNTYVKALQRKLRKITNFWGNCHWDSLLHYFYALIIFFIKALRQWWQIREAMKRWNRYYSKKLKQWRDEAFNAGKEIEALKRLTLHWIALSLHRFYCPALTRSIQTKISMPGGRGGSGREEEINPCTPSLHNFSMMYWYTHVSIFPPKHLYITDRITPKTTGLQL